MCPFGGPRRPARILSDFLPEVTLVWPTPRMPKARSWVGKAGVCPTNQASRWTAATGWVPLANLPGATSSIAYDVNADGSVVSPARPRRQQQRQRNILPKEGRLGYQSNAARLSSFISVVLRVGGCCSSPTKSSPITPSARVKAAGLVGIHLSRPFRLTCGAAFPRLDQLHCFTGCGFSAGLEKRLTPASHLG
jgi:hypothetical protein